ncbi:MAG: signal peptidase I [Cyanobacteria bacterium P01_A01_bin.116]
MIVSKKMAAETPQSDQDLSNKNLSSNAHKESASSSEAAASASGKTEPKRGWRKGLIENVRLVAIALFIATIIRIFIAEPRFIPSPSMVPTLAVGDRLLVEKVSYHLHEPRQGDIVVFQPPPQLQEYGYKTSQAFIKRVIGLPGQTIQVSQGQVIVDGKPLREDYIQETPNYEMPPVQVPEGSLFMMGDNRNDSNDSHVWGFLPEENVIGRAVVRFWPLEKAGIFESQAV